MKWFKKEEMRVRKTQEILPNFCHAQIPSCYIFLILFNANKMYPLKDLYGIFFNPNKM